MIGKWLLWAAAVPLGGAVLVVGVGALLPRDHVASQEVIVSARPDEVAELVRDVEAQPRWRSGVRSVEVLERRTRGMRYVERSGDGAITFDFHEEAAGTRFRSTIADPDLPFGGAWTIALAAEGAGTRVRIEEKGFVTNPIYRFFAALVFGHERTMKAYLADLQRAVGR
jgi:hypothetical protein